MYLSKICQIFPDFQIDKFWCSTVVCGSCARTLRSFSPNSEISIPASFRPGEKYIFGNRYRSLRQVAVKNHRDCPLCTIANAPNSGCIKTPPKPQASNPTNVKKPVTPAPVEQVFISHEDLKRIQVENNLTQNQILGVMQGLRYASHGCVATPPGFKQFLEDQNKIFEDIFKVRKGKNYFI